MLPSSTHSKKVEVEHEVRIASFMLCAQGVGPSHIRRVNKLHAMQNVDVAINTFMGCSRLLLSMLLHEINQSDTRKKVDSCNGSAITLRVCHVYNDRVALVLSQLQAKTRDKNDK